jgi:hypothetical protein
MSTAVALPGHEIVGIIAPGELVELGIVQSVPIVGVPWFDTRQTCSLVHDYLAGAIEGTFEEYHACSGYAAGVCRGTGGAGLLCLFHEADQSLAWTKARQWRRVRLSDGRTALEQRQQ